MHIGIFDSGIGGELVAHTLRNLLPHHHYTVINDLEHAPYGERSYDAIRSLTQAAIQPLLVCDIIVIACNTATAAAITQLRETYPDKYFVGFEPMIKPAVHATQTQHVTLLATKATAYSQRTEELIASYAPHLTVDRPNTLGWARHIDAGRSNSVSLDDVGRSVDAGSDTIIIGCTHYIALLPRLRRKFPHTTILEPTEAVARRIETFINSQPQQ